MSHIVKKFDIAKDGSDTGIISIYSEGKRTGVSLFIDGNLEWALSFSISGTREIAKFIVKKYK